jgi:transketolase
MQFDRLSMKIYSRLGQTGAVAGYAIKELGTNHDDFFVAYADSVAIVKQNNFQTLFPEKVVNVGIAEQSLVGIAAGLAGLSEGGCYAFTYAAFITLRAMEQLRIYLSYQKCNVKLVGVFGGYAMGALGVSHWTPEELAMVRLLPNITVCTPADAAEAIKMIMASYEVKSPMYIRLSGVENCPIVYTEDYQFCFGKAITLKEGNNIAIIANGLMVAESLKAAKIMESHGIECGVINMHTLKPLDTGILNEYVSKTRLIVTVEEASIAGGLGGSVAEYLSSKNEGVPLLRLGASDFQARLGSQSFIREQYGLIAAHIADSILERIGEL